jgi:hypothetical protein
MAKGTGLVKSRERYRKLISVFPEREEFYLAEIARVEAEIVAIGVCKRCGRPLKDEEARRLGYGKECLVKSQADLEAKTD